MMPKITILTVSSASICQGHSVQQLIPLAMTLPGAELGAVALARLLTKHEDRLSNALFTHAGPPGTGC